MISTFLFLVLLVSISTSNCEKEIIRSQEDTPCVNIKSRYCSGCMQWEFSCCRPGQVVCIDPYATGCDGIAFCFE